jgi:hypothetical protein
VPPDPGHPGRSDDGAPASARANGAHAAPSPPAEGQPFEAERRELAERRRSPTRVWHSLLGRGRRRRGRRRGEDRDIYVDAYRSGDLLLLVIAFLLNVLDAFFTLIWVGEGGGERNPLMDRLLQSGDQVFLNVKLFVAGVAFIWLMAHKNFRLARIGLWLLVAIYGALLLYHIALRIIG